VCESPSLFIDETARRADVVRLRTEEARNVRNLRSYAEL